MKKIIFNTAVIIAALIHIPSAYAQTCKVTWKDGGKNVLNLNGSQLSLTHSHHGSPVTWTNKLSGKLNNGKFSSPNTGRWFSIKGKRIYTGPKGKGRDNSGRIAC